MRRLRGAFNDHDLKAPTDERLYAMWRHHVITGSRSFISSKLGAVNRQRRLRCMALGSQSTVDCTQFRMKGTVIDDSDKHRTGTAFVARPDSGEAVGGGLHLHERFGKKHQERAKGRRGLWATGKGSGNGLQGHTLQLECGLREHRSDGIGVR